MRCRLNCEVDRWQQIARNPVEYGWSESGVFIGAKLRSEPVLFVVSHWNWKMTDPVLTAKTGHEHT